MKSSTASPSKRIPKLRFPEFRDAPEWEEKKFGELFGLKATNTLSRDKLNYESGTVKNIHYGDIHTKFSTLFRVEQEHVPFINPSEPTQGIKPDSYCKVGDMVFADASEDLDDVGKSIEITNLNGEKVVSGLHTILARQKKRKLIVGFGGHLFKSQFLRKQIQREAQGAKVLGISGGRLSNIDVCFPEDVAEQQRIADCLSSLDEWIAIESKRLDALKDHKKGLMQQLFPAEGETTPKLRFPEFQDAPEWEVKKLGKISIVLRGGSPRPINDYLTKDKDGLNWLKIGDVEKGAKFIEHTEDRVIPSALSKTREVLPGDLIMSNSMSFGRPYILKIKSCIHDGWIAITELDEAINTEFLYYLILSVPSQKYFLDAAAGGGIKNLNAEIIKSLPLTYPKEAEQQRIADCLSSLDEWIATEANRIDALRDHKKGLMQQLFPSCEEANL